MEEMNETHEPMDLLSLGTNIWGFPKNRGFPPKSSILTKVFHYKPSILGTPIFGNTHIPFKGTFESMMIFPLFPNQIII